MPAAQGEPSITAWTSKLILTCQIKCSREAPCRNCSVAGVACEFRVDDSKRPPPSRDYVAALQDKIAALEAALEERMMMTSSENSPKVDEVHSSDRAWSLPHEQVYNQTPESVEDRDSSQGDHVPTVSKSMRLADSV